MLKKFLVSAENSLEHFDVNVANLAQHLLLYFTLI